MKLKKGVSVERGSQRWVGEIPDEIVLELGLDPAQIEATEEYEQEAK